MHSDIIDVESNLHCRNTSIALYIIQNLIFTFTMTYWVFHPVWINITFCVVSLKILHLLRVPGWTELQCLSRLYKCWINIHPSWCSIRASCRDMSLLTCWRSQSCVWSPASLKIHSAFWENEKTFRCWSFHACNYSESVYVAFTLLYSRSHPLFFFFSFSPEGKTLFIHSFIFLVSNDIQFTSMLLRMQTINIV